VYLPIIHNVVKKDNNLQNRGDVIMKSFFTGLCLFALLLVATACSNSLNNPCEEAVLKAADCTGMEPSTVPEDCSGNNLAIAEMVLGSDCSEIKNMGKADSVLCEWLPSFCDQGKASCQDDSDCDTEIGCHNEKCQIRIENRDYVGKFKAFLESGFYPAVIVDGDDAGEICQVAVYETSLFDVPDFSVEVTCEIYKYMDITVAYYVPLFHFGLSVMDNYEVKEFSLTEEGDQITLSASVTEEQRKNGMLEKVLDYSFLGIKNSAGEYTLTLDGFSYLEPTNEKITVTFSVPTERE